MCVMTLTGRKNLHSAQVCAFFYLFFPHVLIKLLNPIFDLNLLTIEKYSKIAVIISSSCAFSLWGKRLHFIFILYSWVFSRLDTQLYFLPESDKAFHFPLSVENRGILEFLGNFGFWDRGLQTKSIKFETEFYSKYRFL